MFAGTAVKRTGRDRFLRNVLIAIGNSGDAALAADAERLLTDQAAIVRGAAIWALARLVSASKFAELAGRHRCDEADPEVQQEWAGAEAPP